MEPQEIKLEIAKGLTAEKLTAIYFDKDALRVQPEPLYRMDINGERYYYNFDTSGEPLTEPGSPVFYSSVTTLIQRTLPTSPHLIKWIADKGYAEAKAFTQEMADWGTFLHMEIANLMINKKCDLDGLKKRLEDFVEGEGLPKSFLDYETPIKKDLLAFAQFFVDYKVKPLFIELVLCHPDGYAGAIDLCCKLTVEEWGYHGETYKKANGKGAKKGDAKRSKGPVERVGIVDWKRGRKGFFESHEIQLEGYKRLVNKNFPELEVERIFNWAPNDWRGTEPTYKIKDQTESPNIAKFPKLLELDRIERAKREKTFTQIGGTIDLDNFSIHDHVKILDIGELIKSKADERPNS